MNKLDDSIVNVRYILDTLMTYRDIAKSGNCNNCGRMKCQYKPGIGKLIRYNCFYWKGEQNEID